MRTKLGLLGLLGLVGLLAAQSARPAAVASGALIGLIGGVHLLWVFGTPWPARDREQLVAYVMPRHGRSLLESKPGSGFPSRAATLAVTCGFLAMSACLLTPPDALARLVPGGRWLVLAIAGVFAMRGAFGLVYWSRKRESILGKPSVFLVYNRLVYSPACLLIAALAAASTATRR